MGWFWRLIRRLRGVPDPWAAIANRGTVYYFERTRRMTIAGEMLKDGFEIYVASIVAWDDGRGEIIGAAEHERILANVKASLESQGGRVILS